MIEKIIKIAQSYFDTSRGSHDWDHSERVMKLAMHLAEKEKANLKVVQIAAILHDIGRETQDKSRGNICHAEEGARLAKKILQEFNLSEAEKTNIIHCIESHRFRNSHEPETLEAKVLYDADKLDSIGAVGIGRAFLFAGEIGSKLHNSTIDISKTKAYTKEDTAYREFIVKLAKVKDRLLTKEGRQIANGRHEFMVQFFDRMNREVEGEE
ncbi:MAG: HD domain-containing protein [Candidatus Marinimicrobia bacterium]|nr:HD domain-containing protein [Candidatus Neomarinimicrobiota bacterium]